MYCPECGGIVWDDGEFLVCETDDCPEQGVQYYAEDFGLDVDKDDDESA